VEIDTYSKSKYSAVIVQCGGWDWFQRLLGVLSGVARKHGVTVANVATRWVLDKPTVAAVIIGVRPPLRGWPGACVAHLPRPE
jgi:aryl-alcohol dehydrogenase-like predicted oxidoreductase